MTPLDPDPLHVDDERIPSSKPYRLVPDSPRRGCSVLGFIIFAAFLLVGSATPRAASEPVAAAGELRAVQGQPGAPLGPESRLRATFDALPPLAGLFDASQPGVAHAAIPSPAQDANAVTFEGTLSWVAPSYGTRYLALPQPRGTRARICGPADCVTRISTDYGPDQRANPDRIADLSVADWSRVCGVPLSFGLCPGTVTLAGLPATDQ